MYQYLRSSPVQRRELLKERVDRGFPLHSPPHGAPLERTYMITVACYEHRPLMQDERRRLQIVEEFARSIDGQGTKIEAWVVLPNHYHLLLDTPDLREFGKVVRLVHGRTSRLWNIEDAQPGRKCWFRFSDRAVRSEAHYFAALNYIHANPVKHKLADSGLDWSASSIHEFEAELGIELLRDLWTKYPVGTMGDGWDD
jgi:putative transposase